MFNIKLSSIVAVIAFVLSFLTGIISGGSFFIVLIRALICGVAFSALITGMRLLIVLFLPELFQSDEKEDAGENAVGTNVDISVEDNGENSNSFKESNANVSNAKDATMDQSHEKAYTNKVEAEGNSIKPSAIPNTRQESPATPNVGNKQNKGKTIDTSKMDPKKMASAIQTMLKQG